VEELGAVGAFGAGERRRRAAGCRAAGADLVLLLLRPCKGFAQREGDEDGGVGVSVMATPARSRRERGSRPHR
jgi:hypothetical protein